MNAQANGTRLDLEEAGIMVFTLAGNGGITFPPRLRRHGNDGAEGRDQAVAFSATG